MRQVGWGGVGWARCCRKNDEKSKFLNFSKKSHIGQKWVEVRSETHFMKFFVYVEGPYSARNRRGSLWLVGVAGYLLNMDPRDTRGVGGGVFAQKSKFLNFSKKADIGQKCVEMRSETHFMKFFVYVDGP